MTSRHIQRLERCTSSHVAQGCLRGRCAYVARLGSFHKRGMHSPVCPYLPRMSLDVMSRLMGATDNGLMTITLITYQKIGRAHV